LAISRTIIAHGHVNILATNKTTFEITKEEHLSKKGDCIIAVSADKALSDFDETFKRRVCSDRANLTILVEADRVVEKAHES